MVICRYVCFLWAGLFCHFVKLYPAVTITDTIRGLEKMDSAVHFLVVGDWGRMGSPGQRQVADAMAKASQQLGVSFIITTGDNFYPSGVSGVSDSQWVYSFEKVYQASSLQRRWMAVLGNHDYVTNPQAEVDYTFESARWFMPARFYDSCFVAGNDSVLLAFLDTEPMERKLRGKLPDADSLPYTVELQMEWLKKLLASSNAKWKIVVGHHPLHTGGSMRHNIRVKKLRRLLGPVFSSNRVNLYLSGHEHHLELLKPKGPTHFVISGAGSETGHVGWLKRYRRFVARKRGFVSVSIGRQKCLVQFISDRNKVLYKYFL